MSPALDLAGYFALQTVYSQLFREYLARGVVRTLDPNDKEFAGQGEVAVQQYFDVGADALRVVIRALLNNHRPPPATILDFPCGSGRVARHLRACFPDARVVASDLYEYHVDFCVRELQTDGFLSAERISGLDFGQTFDLIFCGSLLTHLPEQQIRDVIRLFSRSLNDNGLAIVTLHGRHAEWVQRHGWKYVEDRLFAGTEAALAATGFSFVAYDRAARAPFDKQSEYGATFVRPHWMTAELAPLYDIRLLGYSERDWDDHQDVLVFGRPGVDA